MIDMRQRVLDAILTDITRLHVLYKEKGWDENYNLLEALGYDVEIGAIPDYLHSLSDEELLKIYDEVMK